MTSTVFILTSSISTWETFQLLAMFSHSGISYRSVSKSETSEDLNLEDIVEPMQHRLSLRKIVILILIAIFTIFATVFGAVETAIFRQAYHKSGTHNHMPNVNATINTPNQSLLSQAPKYTTCGESAAEARSRNCTFDITSFSWLTPECYEDTLAQEFISWSNWTWYTSEDPEDNKQLSFEAANLGEEDTFVDWNYHMVHCTFMWRQQHRGTEKGWIGGHLVNYHHTKHCQQALLEDASENRNVRTPARVVYPRCLKIGMGEGMYPGPIGKG
ncbi:hypothetical protein VTL71DRAFT_6826 [Oculimacula yallundae]|uniref:Uncharacterized protein n=1 Tax=Oculimacula yallundae TaxID=86028 RepID=A0ABR4BY23_9HELO